MSCVGSSFLFSLCALVTTSTTMMNSLRERVSHLTYEINLKPVHITTETEKMAAAPRVAGSFLRTTRKAIDGPRLMRDPA